MPFSFSLFQRWQEKVGSIQLIVTLPLHTESLHPDSNPRSLGIGRALLNQNIGRFSGEYHATWIRNEKRKKLREIDFDH